MDDSQREQILAEVEQFSQPPRLKANEFTVRDFAEHAEISYGMAAHRLENQLREGRLGRRKVLEDGHGKWAYHITGGESGVDS